MRFTYLEKNLTWNFLFSLLYLDFFIFVCFSSRILLLLNRYSYPFGRPEGGLKAAISLLERVSSFVS